MNQQPKELRRMLFRGNNSQTDQKMQSNMLSNSIEEEELIDNIQPSLVSNSVASSISSNFTCDDSKHMDVELSRLLECCDSPCTNLQCVEVGQTSFKRAKNIDIAHAAKEYQSRPMSPKTKLSVSLHDVSSIPTFPLTSKSSHLSSSTIQSQSMTTDASLHKSKDSGFPRSLSCFSLNSSRSYAHVQSKVKKYINQIKEENVSNRKSLPKECSIAEKEFVKQELTEDDSVSVKMLMPIIDKLKDELNDKEKMLLKLQENYDTLLMKYAAAENRIDHLRVSSADVANSTPFNFDIADYKKSQASPSLLLLPELKAIFNENNLDSSLQQPSSKQSINLKLPKHSLCKNRSTVLSPITKKCSNSVRLDEPLQPLIPKPTQILSKEEQSKSAHIDAHAHDNSKYQILDRQLEIKELSPERLNSHKAENLFIKVKRWQESLPSFELFEPNMYNTPNNDSLISKDFNFSYSNKHDNECGSHSLSNLLLRSISQPNYTLDESENRFKSCYNLSAQSNPARGSNEKILSLCDTSLLNTSDSQSGISTVSQADYNCIKIQSSSPCQSIKAANRYKNLGILDSSHLSRKRLLGQKARLILFEYLKNSKSNDAFSNFCKISKPFEKNFVSSSYTKHSHLMCDSFDISIDDDISLGNCLDEMNQRAHNLQGKSEAIMQVLAKQLKDP